MGKQCQQGFYTFFYIGDDSETKLVLGDGNERTFDLHIPYDHRLNLATIGRTHTDSEAWDIRYIAEGVDPDYYDLLYQNATLTSRSVVVELGDTYENRKDSIVRFVATITDTKKVMLKVNIQFLEVPEGN